MYSESHCHLGDMSLGDIREAKIRLTGGVDGGRGWRGDVKIMQLDMNELRLAGWTPKYGSAEAVRLTARSVIGG